MKKKKKFTKDNKCDVSSKKKGQIPTESHRNWQCKFLPLCSPCSCYTLILSKTCFAVTTASWQLRQLDKLHSHSMNFNFESIYMHCVMYRKISEVNLGTLDVKSGPTRCQKGLQLQLMCCAPFRLLSQDFGTEVRGQKIRGMIGVVLRVELRGWELRGELIQYLNWGIYMTSPRYLY